MPSVSSAQHSLMEAAAHTPGGYGGVPQKVGKEFVGKDAGVTAAGVILRAPDGSLLFLKRGAGGDHEGAWCFPGGSAEAGEDAEAAARRELEEETGHSVDGPLHGLDVRSNDDVKFATFVRDVAEKFVPKLNEEHVGFAWAPPSNPPEPLHPGVKATLTEPQRANDEALAFDRATARTYDKDGRLHVEITNISKANVCPYLGREIPDCEALGLDADKSYQLLRDPEELAKAAGSFNNVPLLSRHVPVTADNHQPDLVIGSTGTDAEFVSPYLRNSLVIWARDAIDGVESEVKKELSSAYRYRADMTPGTYGGQKYDGVMRDIVGNHVALVPEGRAGPDVVVGDSAPPAKQTTQEIHMTTKPVVLSRKAAVAQGALLAFLLPKLAQDAKIDLASVLVGVSAKNFKDKKPAILAGLKDRTKDKLAKDASIDDIAQLLDVLESAEVTEGADTDPSSGLPMAAQEMQAKALDADPIEKLKAFLKGKVSDADLAAIDKIIGEGKAMDETDEQRAKREEEEKRAKDAELKPDTVTKGAMDAAIAAAAKSATETAIKTQQGIRDAERAVRPWVGDLAMALDSAEAVYRTALTTLGVKVDGVHPSAFPTILSMQPQPGAKKATPVAMDAAGTKGFAERFPDAARVGQV